MRKIHVLMILGSVIVSSYALNFIEKNNVLDFLNSMPTIMGILLAMTLTSLAIILGMIGNAEMAVMKEYEKINGKKYYRKIIDNLKWDIYFVFSAFIVSFISRIFSNRDSTLSIQLSDYLSYNIYEVLFIIEISLLVASLIVINDLIKGLFDLNEARYEIANMGEVNDSKK
jgi:type III secretory pathway component EscU